MVMFIGRNITEKQSACIQQSLCAIAWIINPSNTLIVPGNVQGKMWMLLKGMQHQQEINKDMFSR